MLTMLLPGGLRQENDCKLKTNLVFTRVSAYPRLPSKTLKPQKEKKKDVAQFIQFRPLRVLCQKLEEAHISS